VGGTGGTGGSAGAGGCIPIDCASTNQCGSNIPDGCGSTIECGCQGTTACVGGTCTFVVNTYCNACAGGFSEQAAAFAVSFCNGACANDNFKVCTIPGWGTKVTVQTSTPCPNGFHVAPTLTEMHCDGKNRYVCVEDK
jgi:hypothetical protein